MQFIGATAMIRNLKLSIRSLAIICLGLISLRAGAGVIPIDPTNFDADPADKVMFHPDGSATMEEDDFFGSTLLTNAPPTNPEVIVALPKTILSFHYDFNYGTSDEGDYFSAVLLESGVATGYEVFIDIAGSGVVEFDLDALGLTNIPELGIEFTLASDDFEYGSTVLISNLQTRVPLPATLLLLGSGLFGLRSPRRLCVFVRRIRGEIFQGGKGGRSFANGHRWIRLKSALPRETPCILCGGRGGQICS